MSICDDGGVGDDVDVSFCVEIAAGIDVCVRVSACSDLGVNFICSPPFP